jgi:hypothetical protein
MLDNSYIVRSFALLPNPRGIPFHLQGMPIPDPLQKHATAVQQGVVDSDYSKSNTLPLGRFLGTVWPQQNQPKFLGANERVVFESTW